MNNDHISGRNATELVQNIEKAIREGSLHAEEPMPTVRQLAKQLGLSPGTVASAFKTLRQRGQIRTNGRNGTFISTSSVPPSRNPPRLRPGLIDLASGSPDPTLLPDLTPILHRFEGPSRLYPDEPVLDSLAAIARVRLNSDEIPVGSLTIVAGALDGVERALQAHLRPGDRVGVEDPGYPPLFTLLAALGLQAVGLHIDQFGILPEDLSKKLSGSLQAIIVTPRAQNPMGCAFSANRASALRDLLQLHPRVLLVEDDHAGEIAGAALRTLCAAGNEHWVHIRSVSKSLGPDLRLAVLTGDEVSVSRIEHRRSLGAGWVPFLIQTIVAQLWEDPATDEVLTHAREVYALRRDALKKALSKFGLTSYGLSGLNIWVPVTDEHAALASLDEAGFAASAGQRYRIAAEPAIRINIARLDTKLVDKVAGAVITSASGLGQSYQP